MYSSYGLNDNTVMNKKMKLIKEYNTNHRNQHIRKFNKKI